MLRSWVSVASASMRRHLQTNSASRPIGLAGLLSTDRNAGVDLSLYPLERAPNPWMDELDRILLALAEEVYAVVSFSFELVGKGISGTHSTSEISAPRAASGTPVCSRRLRNHTLAVTLRA